VWITSLQTFPVVATWAQGVPSVAFAARAVVTGRARVRRRPAPRPRAVPVVRVARTGRDPATAVLRVFERAPQRMADAANEGGGTGAAAPPPLADATADADAGATAAPAVAAAQVAAAAARELYLSIVHSALGRPATVHMVDGYVALLVLSAARFVTRAATALFFCQWCHGGRRLRMSRALRGADLAPSRFFFSLSTLVSPALVIPLPWPCPPRSVCTRWGVCSDRQARDVTSLVAVDISAGGGGNLAVRGLSTPLGVLPAATLRGDDVVAVDVELAAPITLPVARR